MYFVIQGIKVDFFRPSEDDDCNPLSLGYTNILPLHLESGSGSVVLAVNNSHGFPIGQVTGKQLFSDVSDAEYTVLFLDIRSMRHLAPVLDSLMDLNYFNLISL